MSRNIHGHDRQSHARDIADAALRGESIVPSDDLYKSGTTIRDNDGVVTHIVTNTGNSATDKAHSTHSEADTANE